MKKILFLLCLFSNALAYSFDSDVSDINFISDSESEEHEEIRVHNKNFEREFFRRLILSEVDIKLAHEILSFSKYRSIKEFGVVFNLIRYFKNPDVYTVDPSSEILDNNLPFLEDYGTEGLDVSLIFDIARLVRFKSQENFDRAVELVSEFLPQEDNE